MILERLADGSLTLTPIGLLAPHLTPANHLEVLDDARHRSKREVERIVARLRPQPDVPASVRRLPTATAARPVPPAAPAMASPLRPGDIAGNQPVAKHDRVEIPMSSPQDAIGGSDARAVPPPRPAEVVPLAPERYKLQVTISGDTMRTLRQVQHLMRHAIPDGDLDEILGRALMLLLAHVERTKRAATAAPRESRDLTLGSRHIPAAVRRSVWTRDEGRCAFVGAAGRCAERAFLEFHHVTPYARGGEATVGSIELRCRAHNAFEAELDFGHRAGRQPQVRGRRQRTRACSRDRVSGYTGYGHGGDVTSHVSSDSGEP